MAGASVLVARARTDARDWLIEADEPLAGLQLRNGGELPGPIMAPALLELVRKARFGRFRLARAIEARSGEDHVSAWVEVDPQASDEGCLLAISNWHSEPVSAHTLPAEAERQAAFVRQFSELSARLGPAQELLAADSSAPDLALFVERMRAGTGRAWTDFVELEGYSHKQPMHWRLLDGARLRLDGSERGWTAHLLPQGRPVAGSDGFELHFVADSPLPEVPPLASAAASDQVPAIGKDLAPVLRRPVSRIIANAETIRTQLAGPLAEEYSKYAADIASAGEHLLALLDDLTTLEMIEEPGFAPAPDDIDLADIARRAAGILGMRASERGIAVDLPKEDEAAPAIGEFRRVLQILLNLLGNAIRYTSAGGQIRIEVEVKGPMARVTVADQGEGLDEAEQARVFAKFERLGRTGDGGSGLGLYISRRLAEAMEGTLEVESAKGEGARFTLTLPALRDSPG